MPVRVGRRLCVPFVRQPEHRHRAAEPAPPSLPPRPILSATPHRRERGRRSRHEIQRFPGAAIPLRCHSPGPCHIDGDRRLPSSRSPSRIPSSRNAAHPPMPLTSSAFRGDAGRRSAPADHRIGVRQQPGAAADRSAPNKSVPARRPSASALLAAGRAAEWLGGFRKDLSVR
jgi:hypothetical protein